MLSIARFTFAYRGSEEPQLTEVTLEISDGDRVAIMGATGAGKTTLAMACNGLVPNLRTGRYAGEVIVDGRSTREHDTAQLVTDVGLVMQDPETQILGRTVLEDAAMGPANLGLQRAEVLDRARAALTAVGLGDLDEERESDTLSGGQKQRLALAGVLAMRPRLLVLDEATSELDPLGAQAVFAVVRDLAEQGGHTVIVVGHDAEFVAEWATRLVVLDGGRVAFDGAPAQLFRQPARARALGVAVPQIAELGAALAGAGLIAADGLPLTMDQAVERIGPLVTRLTPTPEPVRRPTVGASPVIEARSVRHTYANGVQALRDVSLTVQAGELVALVGANGAGKTTFAKHLNGLLRPTSGELRIAGAPTDARSVADLARHVGYVFQNPDHQIFAPTVADEVAYGLRNAGTDPQHVALRVEQVLAQVGLDDQAEAHPFRLGKGQRQRVAVASVLAMAPQVLVVDEPTTGQDLRGAESMLALMAELHRAGHTVLIITHDMPLVASFAHRVLVFDHGRVVADAPPAAVFSDAALLRRCRLAPPRISQLAARLGIGPASTVAECLDAWQVSGVR